MERISVPKLVYFAGEKACIFRAILPATEVVCVEVELKILLP